MNMDYSATALCHPSLFQRPQADAVLNENPSLVSKTDPNAIWGKRHTAAPHELGESAGKPMTLQERRQLIGKMAPAVRLNINRQLSKLLLPVFMSRANAENLHFLLRRLVKEFSGHVIGRQSDTELTAAMLAVYNAHAVNIDEDHVPRAELIPHVRREVLRLNSIVAQVLVPRLVNAVEQHVGFLAAVENPRSATSLALPENTNTKGGKQL
jgi:uncharacterized protein DUF5761